MQDRYNSILIGGSGFIGTRLAVSLAKQGERVLNLSRHTPRKPAVGVDFFELDFTDERGTKPFLLPRTEVVVILIGQTGPHFNPEADRLALHAILSKVNAQSEPVKVLYCSTALIYGDSDTPSRESDPTHPVETYARHKAENEVFLREQLAPQHHLAILRLSNVYGDTRSRGFISLIMNRLLEPLPEPFSLNGDGNQERDYIYIEDLVEAISAVKAGLCDRSTINISTGESHSLLSAIKSVEVVSGKKLSFSVTYKSIVEANKIRVSNERLSKVYGYTPRHTFMEGLRVMWETAQAEQNQRIL